MCIAYTCQSISFNSIDINATVSVASGATFVAAIKINRLHCYLRTERERKKCDKEKQIYDLMGLCPFLFSSSNSFLSLSVLLCFGCYMFNIIDTVNDDHQYPPIIDKTRVRTLRRRNGILNNEDGKVVAAGVACLWRQQRNINNLTEKGSKQREKK